MINKYIIINRIYDFYLILGIYDINYEYNKYNNRYKKSIVKYNSKNIYIYTIYIHTCKHKLSDVDLIFK